jgi:prepilin-type N-terminal cleavage/methylation domain-containing protein
MKPRTKDSASGFTLLEILIAMSVLVVGATAILSIFVGALHFQTQRVEDNRVAELRQYARQHAQLLLDNYDPTLTKKQERMPPSMLVDLTDPNSEAIRRDPVLRDLAERFPGYKYQITFESNPLGEGVIADIRLWRLSGQEDTSQEWVKEFLNRSHTPWSEFDHSPSKEALDADKAKKRD